MCVALFVVDAFVALTAVGGGIALVDGLERGRFSLEMLRGTPFGSYVSVFGNMEQVAQAIGKALGDGEGVEVLWVSEVSPERLADVELLIVGSPTRGFRPTEGITGFLKRIPPDGLRASGWPRSIPGCQRRT